MSIETGKAIEIKNLTCCYGERTPQEVEALREVSFSVKKGEFVGIMGHTGCGKSTLIQLIAGLIPLSGGQILVEGADINDAHYDRTLLRESVGILFQYPEYQLFETTVERDVAFALKHSGLSAAEVRERVQEALELCGFSYEEIRKKSPLSLSGGEKRKVAIAGVLAAHPRIIIFDEPTAGLDPYSRAEFLELAAKLNRQGRTILMVSHDTDSLCEYASRIIVLEKGELVADGTPEEIFRDLEVSRNIHIGTGNVRSIAQGLYERGMIDSPVITTYQGLLEEIKNVWKEGEGS